MSWVDYPDGAKGGTLQRSQSTVTSETAGEASRNSPEEPAVQLRQRVLLFSYAFPPMQVQMAPAVAKAMAGFRRHGYGVDVLCAGSFSGILPEDSSVLPYVERNFERIYRIGPEQGSWATMHRRLQRWVDPPDLMADRQRQAFKFLTSLDLAQYRAVITWSPFHSINPVMVRLKKRRPQLLWLAQFSDPWARNPLEHRHAAKLWNRWHEPATVDAADFIVHTSAYARDMMISGHPPGIVDKTAIIPHCFDRSLFPQRPKARNRRVTLRYVGVLYGRRSPEPLFLALGRILENRPDLNRKLVVELIGHVPPEMLQTAAARALPEGMVCCRGSVNYIESLQLMYDADLLILIDANVQRNLFVPSKLFDYMGANTPIMAIAPPGGSEDAARELECWHARPSDINAVTHALSRAIAYVEHGRQGAWCDERYRRDHDNTNIARRFIDILEKFDSPEKTLRP